MKFILGFAALLITAALVGVVVIVFAVGMLAGPLLAGLDRITNRIQSS